jgi:uncharacterized protein (TIGR04222 family)
MFATLTQDPTWGIAGTDFLWGYGALCVVALATIGWLSLSMRGPRATTDAGVPAEPDLYALAMLSGGPQLAITSAATQLHRDGHLRPGTVADTLETVGTLEQPPTRSSSRSSRPCPRDRGSRSTRCARRSPRATPCGR